jgi:hypothetical protein
MRRLAWQLCGLGLVCVLAGCSGGDLPAAPAPSLPTPQQVAAAPDGAASLVLPDLMDWRIEPAAAVLLAAADLHAWDSFDARSDEAWQAVVDAAAELLRSSDMLALPAMARGQADWLQSTSALREGALAAAAAARRHDPRSLYLAGVQLRASCQACHTRFALQVEPFALRKQP